MFKKLPLLILAILSGVFIISSAHAQDEATFTSVAPDALIVLDESSNMNLNPAGGTNIYGSSTACVADTTNCGTDADSKQNGFSASSTGSCTTNCSRLEIAKRAIFDLLDDDNNDQIDTQDSNSMGIRFGFMRFRDGADTAGNPTGGNILLVKPIATTYQSIYCGAATNGICTISSTCASGECVASVTSGAGGSPLAHALKEAKTYLDAHKAADNVAKDCRQKFVILVTTSLDDCFCEIAGTCVGECAQYAYKNRRAVVTYAKALYDAGYMVFALGFGGQMPGHLRNVLNWAARYGGTDNPISANSGNRDAYTSIDAASVCNNAPSDRNGDCGGVSVTKWWADSSDPGDTTNYPLAGYAFLASNASELSDSLKAAISTIKDQTYSFTRVSVQTVRTIDENYLYEASFKPITTASTQTTETPRTDPFWLGHLRRYSINTDGTLPAYYDWDAGTILRGRSGSTRTIYTCKSGSLTSSFNTAGLTANEIVGMGSTDTAYAGQIIDFIRNGDAAYPDADTTRDNWKLGDIFHSSPISIGSPSPFFSDIVDTAASGSKGYDLYRDAHERSSANGKRLIVAGANDGQFHVFKTGNAGDGGGTELWSFIPPNLLTKLQKIYHSAHTSTMPHQYFVDGPTTASDIWTGTGNGKSKDADEWKAYMIISEGRGGSSTLWCASTNCGGCDTAAAACCGPTYSTTYKHYCGYYAFDVTETVDDNGIPVTPDYKWHFGGTGGLSTTEGPHLGEPWSKITMGRVYIDGYERWVGFTSGGFSSTDCKTANNCSKCDKRGKGFYVIDLLNGTILWKYTICGPDGMVDFDNMKYSLVAQPASVDSDDDGFIDTVYVGDLGGSMWRFKMCTKAQYDADASCGTGSWTGGKYFGASTGEIRPIYTKATAVHSLSGDLWVFWGTGDVNDPTAPNAQEKMYGGKDNDRTTTHASSEFENYTSKCGSAAVGWYINVTNEKMLADPTVYADVVYFTTYNTGVASDACGKSGTAYLYAVNFETSCGAYSDGSRSVFAGTGIASGAVISENPYGGTNVYVTTSEGSQINVVQPPDPYANKANMQYWHDLRVR